MSDLGAIVIDLPDWLALILVVLVAVAAVLVILGRR